MLTKDFGHQWKSHTPPFPMDVLLPFPFAFAKLLLEIVTTIFEVVVIFGAIIFGRLIQLPLFNLFFMYMLEFMVIIHW
jgi:hypothetical protein